ncbi:MAG TPA: helix-turn-helix transcriptional regulator [Candidatus Caccousia avicola]|uniref:Helix-turn-helix transcriptional regulator n=1 Tax=Candidatus Caccousia avicola TaxID=2840721 RepID=A0A9D1DES5_9FIRM|nr:helix-turn-helix transcriptional regulator [Candidatus Caccousia avicola]
MATVGEKIRAARKAKNLTQKQLGELCDPVIAEPTIRRYELGKLNPKFETLSKIAKALQIPVTDLVFECVNDVSALYDFSYEAQIQRNLSQLNAKGVRIAAERVEELTKIDEYRKTPRQD